MVLPTHQRAQGGVHVIFRRRDAASALAVLRQEGCLKARFPRVSPGAVPEAVLLNSSGGVAGGDRLQVRVEAHDGAQLVVTSQAAERFYRALPGSIASVANAVVVERGATLDWLPQETILFDGAALQRTLHVTMAEDGCFTGVESLVFGRAARGETVECAAFRDLIEIRRGGRLLLHDRVRLEGSAAALLRHRAVGGGARAIATLIQVGQGAAAKLEALRTALAGFDAGASAVDDMLIARIVAEDGGCLRRAVMAGLNVLRDGRPLPRVWLC